MISTNVIRVVSALLALWLLVVVAGCGRSWGPQISINWRTAKPEIVQGTPLKYMSIKIGEVQKVEAAGQGVTVQARLYKKYAHYVTEECTFLVQKGTDKEGVFIEVRSLKTDAPPAKDGAVFAGSDSELEVKAHALVTDWKKTATLAAVAIGVILLLLFLTKLFFKLWALVACAAAGGLAAYYLSPFVEQQLRGFLPSEVRVDLIAYAVAFLGGYILATAIVGVLLKPARAGR